MPRLPLRPDATPPTETTPIPPSTRTKKHASIHGEHVRLRRLPQGRQDPRRTRKTPAKITCAGCHADAQSAYAHSYHATARKPDGSAFPQPAPDCHGDAHTILPASDPKSPIYHSNIPATCGACHGQKFLMESTGNSAQPFVSYQQSVHGRAVENGSQQAAVCTDCHGAHDILPANDAASLINKFNVPATCGKCHAGVQTVFTQSIHGQAIAHGNTLAPVCTDCHGIHTIKAPSDPQRSGDAPPTRTSPATPAPAVIRACA